VGCAAKRVECREHGGPIWLEARSESFHVFSNQPADALRAYITYLEQQLRVLRWLFDYQGHLDIIEVVLVGNDELPALGYPNPGIALIELGPPDILMEARTENTDRGEVRSNSSHELTHHVVSKLMPRLPRWLHEGLASYLENTAFRDPQHATVGGGRLYSRNLAFRGPPSMSDLWNWKVDEDGETSRRYTTAWGYVSYLANREPKRFSAFIDALKHRADAREAFEQTFPRFETDEGPQAASFIFNGAQILTELNLAAPPPPAVIIEASPRAVHERRLESWKHAKSVSGKEHKQRLEAERAFIAALDRPGPKLERIIEGEALEKDLTVNGPHPSTQQMRGMGWWSREAQLFWPNAGIEDSLELHLPPAHGRAEVFAVFARGPDYGQFTAALDGAAPRAIDLRAPVLGYSAPVSLGVVQTDQPHTLTIRVTQPGKLFGLDCLVLQPTQVTRD
jgi:hypothetical protein